MEGCHSRYAQNLPETISKMEFKIFEAAHNNLVLKIEEDYPEVGAYLYVYEDGICVRDFLQNDIDTCKDLAYEEYQVPLDKWIKKENEEASQ